MVHTNSGKDAFANLEKSAISVALADQEVGGDGDWTNAPSHSSPAEPPSPSSSTGSPTKIKTAESIAAEEGLISNAARAEKVHDLEEAQQSIFVMSVGATLVYIVIGTVVFMYLYDWPFGKPKGT